jgi:hypothetical protein
MGTSRRALPKHHTLSHAHLHPVEHSLSGRSSHFAYGIVAERPLCHDGSTLAGLAAVSNTEMRGLSKNQ